ncbi:MAG: hypothetical protein ABL936_01460 [Aestuariivirga sp.]
MSNLPAEISINDLPNWSPWPARLLGVETFEPVERNLAKIHNEYSEDKWQKCFDAYTKSGGTMDAHELRRLYYDLSSAKQRAAVRQGKLVGATNSEIMSWYDDILISAMTTALKSAGTVVELGSSFGHIMWMLRKAFPNLIYRGGDFADSAVALAAMLYAQKPDISVEKFDFYAPSYDLIERAKGPVVVVTSQALEQVPQSAGVIETLYKYRKKIDRVFHLEPAYALYDDGSLLGLMRRRYIEINDYNRDLVSTLKDRKDIEIMRLEQNVVGWNPFNSLALIEWRFT